MRTSEVEILRCTLKGSHFIVIAYILETVFQLWDALKNIQDTFIHISEHQKLGCTDYIVNTDNLS